MKMQIDLNAYQLFPLVAARACPALAAHHHPLVLPGPAAAAVRWVAAAVFPSLPSLLATFVVLLTRNAHTHLHTHTRWASKNKSKKK